MAKQAGVYAIKCTANNKVYIGSSVNIKRRWAVHRSDLNRNKHRSQYMQNAWDKYGPDAFELHIIEQISMDELTTNEIKSILLTREQYHLEIFSATIEVFNTRIIAESNLGVKFSDEVCIKIANYRRGTKHTAETKAKLSEIKKHQSHETRAKIGEANKRRQITEEMRDNMSKASLSQSQATIAKISTALRGKSPHNKGKSISQEQKLKISASLQSRTDQITLDNITMTLSEWAKLHGITAWAMRKRINKWGIHKALTTFRREPPVRMRTR